VLQLVEPLTRDKNQGPHRERSLVLVPQAIGEQLGGIHREIRPVAPHGSVEEELPRRLDHCRGRVSNVLLFEDLCQCLAPERIVHDDLGQDIGMGEPGGEKAGFEVEEMAELRLDVALAGARAPAGPCSPCLDDTALAAERFCNGDDEPEVPARPTPRRVFQGSGP